MPSRRSFLTATGAGAIGAAAALSGTAAFAAAPAPGTAPAKAGKTLLTPDQALSLLKEGNRQFLTDSPVRAAVGRQRRLEIAKRQAPG